MAVLLIATLDTKGAEIGYVRSLLQGAGVSTLLMDVGVLGQPAMLADISREEVLSAAGPGLAHFVHEQDRGKAVAASALGATKIASERFQRGDFTGVLALGGSAGTTIATAVMRALPFGVPKLMVSTLASGQVRPYVGPKDILMLHSVTDICGVNRISRVVLANAAHAMAGMVGGRRSLAPAPQDRPLVTATMFGVTTPCVERCRGIVEAGGYEMVVFHAVGTGGEAMESLIDDGLISAVLDVTTTELADELVGGVLSAGPTRLTAAGKRGVPQVISVGALDMVNFGPKSTVPAKFADRNLYVHNASVTLMRTTPEENEQLGLEIGRKASQATGPVAVVLPLRGVSAIDAPGKPFWDPIADRALFSAIRKSAANVQIVEADLHVNDPAFADLLCGTLNNLIAQAGRR